MLPTRELRFLELGLEHFSPARQGGLLASIRHCGARFVVEDDVPADPVVPGGIGSVPVMACPVFYVRRYSRCGYVRLQHFHVILFGTAGSAVAQLALFWAAT